MKYGRLILGALSAAGIVTGSANAATISVGFQETVASEQNADASGPGRFYHISVNPSTPGYGSYAANDSSGNDLADYQRPFTDPVVGWSFIGGGTNGVLTVSNESGGLISWTTTDVTDPPTNTFDSFGQNEGALKLPCGDTTVQEDTFRVFFGLPPAHL